MKEIDLRKYSPPRTTPTSTQKKSGGWIALLNKDIQLFSNKWNSTQRERFYSELQVLLTSGLDIKSAMELIEQEQNKDAHKTLARQLKEAIIQGKSMHQAMQDSGHFSPYEYYSIRIGEETGRLSTILQDLVRYYAKRVKQQRQLVSVFSYPVMVSATAILAVVFMLNFIVPLFADVFQRFGGELPALTRFVLQLSEGFSQYFYIVLILVVAGLLLAWTQREKPSYRKIASTIALRTPLLGDILRKVYLSRFCQVMALLMAAKVPMLHAIDLVKKMIRFYPLETSLEQVEKDILSGIALHKSLEQFSIYPKRLVSLIKVGEEVNQLDSIFDKLAEQLSTEVEHKTAVLSSLLEPMLIVFLALVVGLILVAMYLPMFQLSVNLQ